MSKGFFGAREQTNVPLAHHSRMNEHLCGNGLGAVGTTVASYGLIDYVDVMT